MDTNTTQQQHSNTVVVDRVIKVRGCGKRKEGGLYLVAPPFEAHPCGRMPIILDRCPVCDCGIKPSRGWAWVDLDKLAERTECMTPDKCGACPLAPGRSAEALKRAGLLWIGEKFYPRPADWLKEAQEQGISRRIASVPRGFELGKTWVAVAHRKVKSEWCQTCVTAAVAIKDGCEDCGGTGFIWKAGVFHLFRPTAIEYVTKGTETDEQLAALADRGITPVRVSYDGEAQNQKEEGE